MIPVPGGEFLAAVTVHQREGGLAQGRPYMWVDNRTSQPINLTAGALRFGVTPVVEIIRYINIADDPLLADEAKAAGIRSAHRVTTTATSRAVNSIQRDAHHYPRLLIPELREVFDMLPESLQNRAKRVIDTHFVKGTSAEHQRDLLDNLDIQVRGEDVDAPWIGTPSPVEATTTCLRDDDTAETSNEPVEVTPDQTRFINNVMRTLPTIFEEDPFTERQAREAMTRIHDRRQIQRRDMNRLIVVQPTNPVQPMQAQGGEAGKGLKGQNNSKNNSKNENFESIRAELRQRDRTVTSEAESTEGGSTSA
jgi:hypothetical protein